jgi:glycosyltransferase involved in cell wall biosynthesis
MRLAVYTDADVFGGAEALLGTLLAFLDPSIHVTVVGTNAAIVEAVAARRPGTGVKVVRAPRARWDASALRAHVAALRALRPDMFQVNLRTPYASSYALVSALLMRIRTVAVEHLPLWTRSRYERLLKRATSRALDAHVAVGAELARELERNVPVAPGSVTVIHNGVPDAGGDPPPERAAPGPVVGSLGRLEPQKGIDVMIDALALLEDVTYIVVGEGGERVSLEHRAAEAGVASRVIFTGWSENATALLRGFDVFVQPSRYEGLPLSVLEAMAAGLPIVASNVGSVGEALEPELNGLLVPREDPSALATAVGRLLGDKQLRLRLGRQARQTWAARFDVAVMVKEYERLYLELLG